MASSHDWRATIGAQLPSAPWRTRFAPAPTGYLHLGHLVNMLHVWGIARAYGGQVVLRLEDHDRSRCRPEFEAALLEELDWLGFVPDIFSTASFRDTASAHDGRQSDQQARYQQALDTLDACGLIYACRCTRRDVERVAPHAPGEEPCYPGTCRHAGVARDASPARRLLLAPQPSDFTDLRLGSIRQHPYRQCGDVLVRDRHGQWTYQFAVVVDDLHHGIDVVIRGEDLLESTGRQLQLAALLGRTHPPRVLHHALLVHPDGRKLSKASGDTSLRELRAAGYSAASLLGRAAQMAGLREQASALPPHAIVDLFAG